MLIFLATIEDETEKTKIETIYELYAERMFHLSFSILHNNEDAEDAVQTAMVRACKHVKKLQEPYDKSTMWYVLETTKNISIDIYRKKKMMREMERPFDEPNDGHGLVSQISSDNKLVKKIMELSVNERDVPMLKYVYGFNYSEISENLGMSAVAARKAAQRAREKLERLLEEE